MAGIIGDIEKRSFYCTTGKRLLDLAIAVPALLLLLPVMACAAILLACTFRGRLLFLQQRPGFNQKLFTIFKFRTMTDAHGADGSLLPDGARLTRVGKIIRRTSIDELPQLFNVIKGDMSIIGPRPLLIEYLPLYSDYERLRHAVRPGITGLAQVRGRNATSWRRRFRYDIFYVRHVSLGLDLRLLTETVREALLMRGVSAAGEATMKPYTGKLGTAEKSRLD